MEASEQQARDPIDSFLSAASEAMSGAVHVNSRAYHGVAVREPSLQAGRGFADYPSLP